MSCLTFLVWLVSWLNYGTVDHWTQMFQTPYIFIKTALIRQTGSKNTIRYSLTVQNTEKNKTHIHIYHPDNMSVTKLQCEAWIKNKDTHLQVHSSARKHDYN